MSKHGKNRVSSARPAPMLVVSRVEAQRKIEERIEAGNEIIQQTRLVHNRERLSTFREQYYDWHSYNKELLRRLFDTDELTEEYTPSGLAYVTVGGPPTPICKLAEEVADDVKECQSNLRRICEKLPLIPEVEALPARRDRIKWLEIVFERFHLVAQQLQSRYGGRRTLKVKDEFDVQDLLHAILKLEFDDIRPEEWSPSYAGSSTRMDFLLKAEQAVIEVKRASKKLRDKQLGKQLVEDIAHYQGHPDVKRLFCFIYNPNHQVTNPVGLKNDIEGRSPPRLEVCVFVNPK